MLPEFLNLLAISPVTPPPVDPVTAALFAISVISQFVGSKAFGRGRRTADAFNKNVQNPFNEKLTKYSNDLSSAQKYNRNLTEGEAPVSIEPLRRSFAKDVYTFLQDSQRFAGEGSQQRRIIEQNFQNTDFTDTLDTLLLQYGIPFSPDYKIGGNNNLLGHFIAASERLGDSGSITDIIWNSETGTFDLIVDVVGKIPGIESEKEISGENTITYDPETGGFNLKVDVVDEFPTEPTETATETETEAEETETTTDGEIGTKAETTPETETKEELPDEPFEIPEIPEIPPSNYIPQDDPFSISNINENINNLTGGNVDVSIGKERTEQNFLDNLFRGELDVPLPGFITQRTPFGNRQVPIGGSPTSNKNRNPFISTNPPTGRNSAPNPLDIAGKILQETPFGDRYVDEDSPAGRRLSGVSNENTNINRLTGGNVNVDIDLAGALDRLGVRGGDPGEENPLQSGFSFLQNLFGDDEQLKDILLATLTGTAGGLSNREATSTQEAELEERIVSERNNLLDRYNEFLGEDPDLSGYLANQFSTINERREQQSTNRREQLASLGIEGPAVGTALGSIEDQRFSDIIQAENQLPLLKRNLRQQELGQFGAFLNAAPFGSKSTTKQSGNVLGGATTGLASTLALLRGLGS